MTTDRRSYPPSYIAYLCFVVLTIVLLVYFSGRLTATGKAQTVQFMMIMLVPLTLFNLLFVAISLATSHIQSRWKWVLAGLPFQLFTLGLLVHFIGLYFG